MKAQQPVFRNGRRRGGFTLVELSIVLVIIGLLVGGILVGREMIKTAEIRAGISQYDSLNAATSAFRLKYNCLPADCPNATAFLPIAGNGNGDGRIARPDGLVAIGADNTLPAIEHYMGWQHLSEAKLIPEAAGYGTRGIPSRIPRNYWWMAHMPAVQPVAWFTTAGMGSNVLLLTGPSDVCGFTTCGGSVYSEGLTPIDATSMRSKNRPGPLQHFSGTPGDGSNFADSAPDMVRPD